MRYAQLAIGVMLGVIATQASAHDVLATFDIGSTNISAVRVGGCATVDPTAGKHGGGVRIACQQGQTFFVAPRSQHIGLGGNLEYNLRIEVPPASSNVKFVYYALMGLTAEVTPDSRVRLAQFDPYSGTLKGEVLSSPLDHSYHTVVILQSGLDRLYIDGREVGNLPGETTAPVALATIGSHACDANDCSTVGVQDSFVLDLDDLVTRSDEVVPSGPISGGVMRPTTCASCTWRGAGSRCPGCDTSVCKSCRGTCCATQASHAVDEPAPPDDQTSAVMSRVKTGAESFNHSAVVPLGKTVVGTLLQARMLSGRRSLDPSLLLTVDGVDYRTGCAVSPLLWSTCNAATTGIGRVDWVNPATGLPWSAAELDGATIGVEHANTRARNAVTWISWETVYQE